MAVFLGAVCEPLTSAVSSKHISGLHKFVRMHFPAAPPLTQVNGDSLLTTGRPAVLAVRPGGRHRFRLIAATSSWGLAVRVQEHRLTVAALDGRPVAPRPAAGVVVTPGERVDFILHASEWV